MTRGEKVFKAAALRDKVEELNRIVDVTLTELIQAQKELKQLNGELHGEGTKYVGDRRNG